MKIAVVQKGIEDDDRPSTCPLVREEIRSIIMARDALTGLASMDVSAVCKGKGKGRVQGKNKEKDKEKDPASNLKTRLQYVRERQGQEGVNAVEQAPGLTPGAAAVLSVSPSRVSIEPDDWMLAVSLDDHEEMVGSML